MEYTCFDGKSLFLEVLVPPPDTDIPEAQVVGHVHSFMSNIFHFHYNCEATIKNYFLRVTNKLFAARLYFIYNKIRNPKTKELKPNSLVKFFLGSKRTTRFKS